MKVRPSVFTTEPALDEEAALASERVELKIHIRRYREYIWLQFSEETQFVFITPRQARKLAAEFIAVADLMEKK
jgi:hypothetical protein